MSTNPLVSVITPCYNYARFLSDALESLLSQTYSNWECIIVDDGSTDNTKEVAEAFVRRDKRFIYIYQQNKGVSAARNTALQHTRGEYIQLLDADDMLEKDKLALHVPLLECNKNYDLVYSDVLLFDDNGENSKDWKFRPFQLPGTTPVSGKYEVLIENLLIDNFFLTGCVIFRRKIYEQVGNFIEGLYGLEDWNYWYRAALFGFEFYHDGREGVRALIRGHHSSSSRVHNKMLSGRIKARENILEYMKTLQQQNKLNLNYSFTKKTIKLHNILLMKDKYTYNLLYGNVLSGIKAVLQYAYYSKKPYFSAYDGAHYIKERLKKKQY